jgi:hypothetical protein
MLGTYEAPKTRWALLVSKTPERPSLGSQQWLSGRFRHKLPFKAPSGSLALDPTA